MPHPRLHQWEAAIVRRFRTLLKSHGHPRRVGAKILRAMDREREVHRKWITVGRHLDERARRIWAAAEAKAIGPGAVTLVSRATGLSRGTLHKALKELESGEGLEPGRVRRAGGGRKRLSAKMEGLERTLEALVAPTARGDPVTPLRWTLKSTRLLAAELQQQGFQVSHASVGKILDELGYSLQGTRKTLEGADHPDRDAQFKHISKLVSDYQNRAQPVISVDTKKKELVGEFANGGREWRRKGEPEKVRTHDFIDKKLGKAIPYGVYDVTRNQGLVSVGITSDTSEFAVATVRRWWHELGSRVYPAATDLLITADCGGSNGYRVRLWKLELQKLAHDIGLNIRVAHFPPGTSKWNKIEHRLFCHITHNWRGKPLTSLEVIVNLIGSTKTSAGLDVVAALDKGQYTKGKRVSKAEMKTLAIVPDSFHGEWNYTVQRRN